MDIAATGASLLSAKNAVGVANATAGFVKKAAEAERGLANIIEQGIQANKPEIPHHPGAIDIHA